MEKINFVFESVITKEAKRYCSLCLDLDIASEGDTIEEAKKNLIEAVDQYIELAIENNLPIIRPVPQKENPLVNNPKQVVRHFRIYSNLGIRTYVKASGY
jgi:predicted RNase H-like HicB family nuclease